MEIKTKKNQYYFLSKWLCDFNAFPVDIVDVRTVQIFPPAQSWLADWIQISGAPAASKNIVMVNFNKKKIYIQAV